MARQARAQGRSVRRILLAIGRPILWAIERVLFHVRKGEEGETGE
jgi:hypothetical protein